MAIFTTDYQGVREKAKALLTAALTPAVWVKTTAYPLNSLVRPTTANGHYYRCTQAGTSSATQPTWPITFWGTVTDSGAIWRQEEPTYILDAQGAGYEYPAVVVGDISQVSEIQMALGNQPSPDLRVNLNVIAYQGNTTKTWGQMRAQAFATLDQVLNVIRSYPTLDSYQGVLRATVGTYTLPEVLPVFYRIDLGWLIKMVVKR